MKWYHSLKFKNTLFFLLLGSLFVLAMMLFFLDIKEKQLIEKSKAAVTLATNDLVRGVLLTQQRNEQIVEDMADVASLKKVDAGIVKKMLHPSQEKEIVSGGLWFEPYAEKKDKKNYSYFYHRNENHDFVEIRDYHSKTDILYRNMEFYILGKELHEGETFWTKIYTDPVTKIRMVTVVSPFYRDNKFAGVASLDIELSQKKKQMFSDLVDAEERYYLLADRSGELLICSDRLRSKGIKPNNLKESALSEKIKYIEDFLFFFDDKKKDTPVAKRLLVGSPDFSKDEASQISYELYNKRNENLKKVYFNSKIIEDDPIFHESSIMASFYFPNTSWHLLIVIPEYVVLKDTIAIYNKIMMITTIFAIVAAFLGYLLIRKIIVSPLELIITQVRNIESNPDVEIILDNKSEIGLLAESFNVGIRELTEAREKERRNEILLMQQSKMAAMGEMLDAVAHQWKQPLNALSMYAELIKMNYEDGEVDQAYIEQFQEDIETQINHMTDTLGTFRAFFRPSTTLSQFDLRGVIDDVLLLAKDELTKNTIEVEVVEQDALVLFGSENEFKHLLLNIINNAKDAFIDNNIKKRVISIKMVAGESPRLEIQDSAGGIPESVIENIFQAHFTTKEEGKGTGIGLYMSSQIAQKHHASLRVENREDGACFIVDFTKLSFHG